VYDAGGQRLATQVNGSLTNVLVHDAGGKLLAEYGPPAGSGGTQYVFADHQGSPRVITGANGNVISRHDYAPFGEELGAIGMRTSDQGYGAGDNARQKYAGMENDDGSGMLSKLEDLASVDGPPGSSRTRAERYDGRLHALNYRNETARGQPSLPDFD
jgi:hypothetical protein